MKWTGVAVAGLLASLSLVARDFYRIASRIRMLNELELKNLWDDLIGDELRSTRAVLALSKHPEAATVFLQQKLRPLSVSETQLHSLIERLGSQHNLEWREAYEELEYFDPRLAMSLTDLMHMDAAQTNPTRRRLVNIMSGFSFDEQSIQHDTIELRKSNEGFYNFFGSTEDGCGSSWWAESRIERLNTRFSNRKAVWTRAVRALALLESFSSSDALEVIERMASGHRDAEPTRIAASILADCQRGTGGTKS